MATTEIDATAAAALDAALAASGLTPAPSEREALLAMYTLFKQGVDQLYAMPEARYEAPALVFQAEPKLTAWGA